MIQVTLDKIQYEAFKKAQSLVSHSVPDASIADAIHYLSNFLIKKIEGSKKISACHQFEVGDDSRKSTRSFRAKRKRRKYISVNVRRQLMAECDGHCSFEHPETGVNCDSSYQLHADHIIPVSEGGSDHISNLRMMCGIHNRDRNRSRHPHSDGLAAQRWTPHD